MRSKALAHKFGHFMRLVAWTVVGMFGGDSSTMIPTYIPPTPKETQEE